MPATEQAILTSFLLTPAALPTIISYSTFSSLFPSAERSSPEIKRLYRALQHRRALLADAIAQNIEREVKQGATQKRAVLRSKRAARKEVDDEEVLIERVLFGPTSNLPISQPHTLKSVVPELKTVTEDLEVEIQTLEKEALDLLDEMKATVSELSDLRYGRLANAQLQDEVLESLGGLNAACSKR